jgi:hypothetical protein
MGLAAAAMAVAAFMLPATGRADEPSVCEVAPSTVTFALGPYRGPYLVTTESGARIGHSGWQICPPVPAGRERSWDGCNFSICDLPDGRYRINFADPPAAPTFQFSVASGRITLDTTPFAVQAGFYGVDATGTHRDLIIDLKGYSLPWSIAHWPGPFHGTDTLRRGVAVNQLVGFSLYPNVPYELHFSGAQAAVSLNQSGAVTVPPNGPLALHGRIAALRVAKVNIAPPGAGTWTLDGTEFEGAQDIILPAGAAVTLRQGDARQTLTLDAACHAASTGLAFHISPISGPGQPPTCLP